MMLKSEDEIEQDPHYHHYVREKESTIPLKINFHLVNEDGQIQEKQDYEVEMLKDPTSSQIIQLPFKPWESASHLGSLSLENTNESNKQGKLADLEFDKLLS